MNIINDDLLKLNELKKLLKEAEDNLYSHKENMIKHCEIKIGDEVVCNGYVHTGKTIIVDRIWLHDMYRGEYQFRASGKIKKKSGELGTQRGEWHGNRIQI